MGETDRGGSHSVFIIKEEAVCSVHQTQPFINVEESNAKALWGNHFIPELIKQVIFKGRSGILDKYFEKGAVFADDDIDKAYVRTAEKLAGECKNIIGIKYSYPDFLRTLEYLKIPSFSVLHGCDKMFAELLLMGCDGTVSGVAGVFPEPFVEVYKAWKLKKIEEMQKWQRICIRFCDLLRCGSNMSWFKLALELRGITAGGMRNPQKNLSFSETGGTMRELKDLCEESGISLRL